MFWSEEKKSEVVQVPDDVIDVLYKIECPSLPVDHAFALSQALIRALPWLEEETRAGIHQIHGAESGNGWYRPEDPDHDLLYLSRRTRLALRLPKERLEAARALSGCELDIDGHPLKVGEASVRPLSPLTTVFSRHVVAGTDEGEEPFLERMARELKDSFGIEARKMLSGRGHRIRTPDGDLTTRSLMLAELDVEESIRLQQEGLGPGRKIGCGLFLPHKGIRPVREPTDD